MSNNYSTILTSLIDAQSDDLFHRFELAVAIWNDERVDGQERAETVRKLDEDGLTGKSLSSQVSQFLKVVDVFGDYDSMIAKLDSADKPHSWGAARELAYAKKGGKPAKKAFDANKRASQIAKGMSHDDIVALATALLAQANV